MTKTNDDDDDGELE